MLRNTLLALVLVILSLSLVSGAYVQFTPYVVQSIPDALAYSAAAYYNGKIYLIGGLSGSGSISSSVYIYSQGNWFLGPPLPFPLMSASATTCDGNLYVVGGVNSSSIFGGILQYTGNGWKVISTSMPIPVYGAIVFSYDHQIYVIGGFNYSGNSPVPPVNYIQVYNVLSGTWQIIGHAPVPLAYSAYYFNGTALIVVGGFVGAAQESPYVYLYYPQNNSWVQLPSLPGVVAGGALGYYNGYIYLVGGLFELQGYYYGGEIFYYNNGRWTNSGVFEYQPTMFSAYLMLGNQLIILGGYGPGNVISNAMQVVVINTPPPKPQIVSVTAGNETISLKWYDFNASGYYVVYWSNNTGKVKINVGNVTSYTINNVEDGVTYYVEVIPYNSLGDGPPSNIINVTPYSVPNPPVLNIKLGNKNATLTWYVTFNGGYPIQGYYLFINGSWLNVGNSTSYFLSNLTPGKLYTIGVIAYNKIGNSSMTIRSFVAITKSNLSVFVIKEINGFLVTWNSTYKSKYVLTVTQGSKIILNVTTTKTSYFVNAPYGIYNVILKAINPAGVTTYSFELTYYIQPPTPNVTWILYLNNITLYWKKVPGATYYLVYDNGHLITNTTATFVSFNLSLGINVIKVYAGNSYYYSAPFVISSIQNSIVIMNGTIILEKVPHITVTSTLPVNYNHPQDIDIRSIILVVVLIAVAILLVWIISREGGGGYW